MKKLIAVILAALMLFAATLSVFAYGGWEKDEGGWFYRGVTGGRLTCRTLPDDYGWCYVGEDGYWYTTPGWALVPLFDDGAKLNENWIFVMPNGYLKTDRWVKDSVGWCHLNETGCLDRARPVRDSKGLCLMDKEGRWVTKPGWTQMGSLWYYVESDGYLAVNAWKRDSKGWCYLSADGHMVTSNVVPDSKGYCLIDENGYWVTAEGWHEVDSQQYYVKKGGYLQTNGWFYDSESGKWFYFDEHGGLMHDVVVKDSKGLCYITELGYWAVYDGLCTVGLDDLVYVGEDGYLVTDQWIIVPGTGWYYFGPDGYALKNQWKEDELGNGMHWLGEDGGVPCSRIVEIEGNLYYFDASGLWLNEEGLHEVAIFPYGMPVLVYVGVDENGYLLRSVQKAYNVEMNDGYGQIVTLPVTFVFNANGYDDTTSAQYTLN